MTDTPDLSVPYCPGCEPERDPIKEILRAWWCIRHNPLKATELDEALNVEWGQPGLGFREADGDTNRAVQALITGSRHPKLVGKGKRNDKRKAG